MISEKQFFDAARELNVEIAAIRAVALVESRGSGFLPGGEPVILFEPHKFWEELVKRKINPRSYAGKGYDQVLYEKRGTHPYGSVNEQHKRLQLASKINRDAALSAASWGRFQIMGFNYKACGCATLQEFINAMYKNEDEHLRLFCNFLKSTGLDKPLRKKDWAAFAKGYNGKGYKEHNYDGRLADAYKVFFNLKIPRVK